jgi:hypothetical protein
MTTAETLRAEGFAEGRAEGFAEGVAEVLVHMLTMNYPLGSRERGRGGAQDGAPGGAGYVRRRAQDLDGPHRGGRDAGRDGRDLRLAAGSVPRAQARCAGITRRGPPGGFA